MKERGSIASARGRFMKERLKMESKMAMEFSILQTVMFFKGISITISERVLEPIDTIAQENNMTENGKKTIDMGMASSSMLMEINLKEIGLEIRKMDAENCSIQMDRPIRAVLRRICSMERALCIFQMEIDTKEDGKTASRKEKEL